uniref:Uncharacterized protein n=1 Tax=Manihot esculenta TaxID=3983 RepID=A0A2C9W281_MANES
MSGLSDAGRIHLNPTCSISPRILGASAFGSLRSSLSSTTPGSPETISPEPFPVRSSNKITPNA